MTAPAPRMGVRAEGLSAVLGGTEILRGVSIAAEAGAFTGIIGPNGSGKSTFLKCLCRVLRPSRGAVYLGDEPLSGLTWRESARRVAMVAQQIPQGFDFSVMELVMMGRAPHKRALERDNARDRAAARASLETAGLAGLERRAFSTLSGGERQRVMLAQALAQETPVLLLDEPTNHLDINHQFRFLGLVRSLGVTVIAALHDLNLAAAYCDRICVMREGRIAASGLPEEVLTAALIKDLYGVDAEPSRDRTGGLHLIFYPPQTRV